MKTPTSVRLYPPVYARFEKLLALCPPKSAPALINLAISRLCDDTEDGTLLGWDVSPDGVVPIVKNKKAAGIHKTGPEFVARPASSVQPAKGRRAI